MPSFQCHATTTDQQGETYATGTTVVYCDTKGEAAALAAADLGVPASRIMVQEVSEIGFGGANIVPKHLPGQR